MPWDKKHVLSRAEGFNGQRVDATGLYYYNARYYDPLLGRFISADPTIPNASYSQSYNRYSYCVNNPSSAIDLNGLFYIFVCGSGGKASDWDAMIEALNIPESEYHILVEPGETFGGPPWEIQDQVGELTEYLADNKITDIKILGHSEGAAATVTVLNKIADDDSFLSGTSVREELEAAIMLEAPTNGPAGSGLLGWTPVGGWDKTAYSELPERLEEHGMNVKVLDVWNKASIVHSSNNMPGWSLNSYSYNSRQWWYNLALYGSPECVEFLDRGVGTLLWGYHEDPFTDPGVIDKIKDICEK